MPPVRDFNDTGVEFEEEKIVPTSFSKRVTSVMVKWVVDHGLAKSDREAKFLLVAFSFMALSLSVLILYFGSLYVTPPVEEAGIYIPR